MFLLAMLYFILLHIHKSILLLIYKYPQGSVWFLGGEHKTELAFKNQIISSPPLQTYYFVPMLHQLYEIKYTALDKGLLFIFATILVIAEVGF